MTRNHKKRSTKNRDELNSVLNNIFFPSPGALIPITDDIAKQAIERGMKPEDMAYLRSNGYLYCPERDSFVGPAEID